MIRRTLVLAIAAALATAPAAAQPKTPAPEAAPTAEHLQRAKQAFLEGKQLYDAGRAADAVEKFKESYRLSKNPLLLYNIAFAFDGLGDQDLAFFYYRKFLTDAPDTAQTAEQRGLARGRVDAITAELAAAAAPTAELAAAAAPAPADPAVTTAPAVDAPPTAARAYQASDVQHQTIDDAPPGTPLDITAAIPDDAGWQVVLFYRSAGAATFTTVPMTPRYRELVARIPAEAMHGASVQYYIEVRDAKGGVVTRIGRASSPNLVYLDPAATPRFYPDLGPAASAPPAAMPAIAAGPARGTVRRETWIATGSSAVLLAGAVTFHLVAANAAASLEAEVVLSRNGACEGGPPCQPYDERLADLEQRGQRFEVLGKVALGLGVVSTGVAAWFWYRDLSPRRRRTPVTAVAPLLGDGLVGGSATLQF